MLQYLQSKWVKVALLIVVMSMAVAGTMAMLDEDKELKTTLSNGVVVTLHNTPCSMADVKSFLEGTVGPDARNATVTLPKELAEQFGMESVKACYVLEGDKVAIVDANGSGGYIAKDKFK